MTENNGKATLMTADRRPSPKPRTDGPEPEEEESTVDAVDTVDDAETEADETEPAKRPWFRRRLGVLALVAAVVLVAIASVDVVLYLRSDDATATADARTAATNAAQQDVPAVLSYGYAALNDYPAVAKSKTTGDFQAALGALIEQSVVPAAKDQQIVTKSEVAASSVVSAATDKVVLLMFINQTTTSKSLTQPKLEGSRVRVTMQQVNGSWLISQLDPV
jgi:Mce-associated membrane protein